MAEETIINRPPIVVILGHVDHGKSSLLEAIRDFRITQKEAGGITQHIGAYEIEDKGRKITFLDTPGHEAFSAIRSRGARVADIAVLVVAADDGVKPQTLEAYKYIKSANIPFIVAINKIDKPEADAQKVKNELAKNGIFVEGMGGDIPVVETSAKTKQGIEDLLETILLVAEMEPIKTKLGVLARGVVIEAALDSRRGPRATLLVKEGVLKVQDVIATPTTMGKVRIMEDFQGKIKKEAGPSEPVSIIGFEKVPRLGEEFQVFNNLEKAKEFVIKEDKGLRRDQERQVIDSNKKILNLVIKADVIGSLEAIETVVRNIPQKEVIIRILRSGVGDISEDDILLASSGSAYIFGFRVKANSQNQRLAEQKKVPIFLFQVIYDLAQKTREILKEIIEAQEVREDMGKLRVLAVFRSEKDRQIAGGRVFEGVFRKDLKVDIFRDERKIGKGRILNVQKERQDIEKGEKGEEIGLLLETPTKIKEGDIIIAYSLTQKKADF